MSPIDRYSVSRALTLQLDPRGHWLATNSVSRAPQAVEEDALPVLSAFARSSTADAAFENLCEDWEVDRGDFDSTVAKLVELGYLTSGNGDGNGSTLAGEGFAHVLPHFFMIRDSIRVAAYRRAIERHCGGKSVLELGCGSGILSVFAAQAGARSVVAIEESEIASLARRMFEANNCSGVVDLRLGNSRDVTVDEPVDVIIHEILGTDPLSENLLVFLDDARRRFLKPGGTLIPYRLRIACVGIEIEEPPLLDRDRALLEAEQFAATYGMSFEPLIDELRKAPRSRFPRPVDFPKDEPFKAPILTREATLWDLDLRQAPDPDLGRRREICLDVDRPGRLGALLVYFHAHLDDKSVLSTSPFAPPTHWGWDVRGLSKEVVVEPGSTVALTAGTQVQRGSARVAIDWA